MHNAPRRLHFAFLIVHFAAALAFVAVFAKASLLAQPTLPHLRGIGEIRDWFNAGKGHVRLILLLSPT
jgi:hypothetical protein